ncbi:discoidin domain-containing protein [Kitasatospora sp. NPDC059327]|uniref:galactose-binding domain-containing protein n=1 Tax=Kitasatospora sp. NPDC059327 TaxID=3346803 RepID=UPI0036A7DBE9
MRRAHHSTPAPRTLAAATGPADPGHADAPNAPSPSTRRRFASVLGRLGVTLTAALTVAATSAALAPALAAGATAPTTEDPTRAPYDLAVDAPVLIVLGQSNAVGWTTKVTNSADKAQCEAFAHVKSLNRLENRVVGALGATWKPYTCVGSNLGQDRYAAYGEPDIYSTYNTATLSALRWERAIKAGTNLPDLHVIHVAWGAQGIQEAAGPNRNRWWPDRDLADIESLHQLTLNTISNGLRALREAGKRPRIIGMHWNQWETETQTASTISADQVQRAFLGVLGPLQTISGGTSFPVFLYRPRTASTHIRTQYVTDALTGLAARPAPNPYRLLDAAQAVSATGTPLYDPAIPKNLGIYNDGIHYTRAVQEWFADQQWKTVFTDKQFGAPVQATENAALGRPATQSSTNWAGREEAGNAVDGNTGGVYWEATPSYTKYEAQPWWQVDLGAKRTIRSVELFNRTDRLFERLTDFDVIVSDTDLTGRGWADIQADPTVRKIRIKGTAPTKLTVAVGADGRYVRVQLAGTNHLTLPEVQVNVPIG